MSGNCSYEDFYYDYYGSLQFILRIHPLIKNIPLLMARFQMRKQKENLKCAETPQDFGDLKIIKSAPC